MKKIIITASIEAGKGKVIREISTGAILGEGTIVHPLSPTLDNYEEITKEEAEAIKNGVVIDLSEQTELELEYVQSLVDNLNAGETLILSIADAERFVEGIILGENKHWENNKIIAD